MKRNKKIFIIIASVIIIILAAGGVATAFMVFNKTPLAGDTTKTPLTTAQKEELSKKAEAKAQEGFSAADLGEHDKALKAYQDANAMFKQAGDDVGAMKTQMYIDISKLNEKENATKGKADQELDGNLDASKATFEPKAPSQEELDKYKVSE